MTFDPFGDFETRGYLRNVAGEKDPERVKRLEHEAFRARVEEALAALRTDRPLGYQDVLDTHRRLFGDMYPWAGQDRAATAPQVAVGKAGRYDLFAHPQDASRAVEHALDMAADPARMRAKPGEVLGLLCHGHPLLDGNGRTLMTVHAELCRRAGIRIAWEDVAKADYLTALTRELERPGKVLDAFLAPHVRRPAASVAQDAKHLQTLRGLGPAARTAMSPKARPLTMGKILEVMRPPAPATPLPWDTPVAPLAERIRTFEERLKAEKAPAPKQEDKPGPAPDEPQRPRSGPKP